VNVVEIIPTAIISAQNEPVKDGMGSHDCQPATSGSAVGGC
jgi:hypothetical protein